MAEPVSTAISATIHACHFCIELKNAQKESGKYQRFLDHINLDLEHARRMNDAFQKDFKQHPTDREWVATIIKMAKDEIMEFREFIKSFGNSSMKELKDSFDYVVADGIELESRTKFIVSTHNRILAAITTMHTLMARVSHDDSFSLNRPQPGMRKPSGLPPARKNTVPEDWSNHKRTLPRSSDIGP